MGGSPLKATLPNEGSPPQAGLAEGAPVTVHVTADAIRVLPA